MSQKIIDEINRYSCFQFDSTQNRIINLKSQENTNIDEFLGIQFMLDSNRVLHKFEENFEIQIMR
ncbi:hypothetical protein ALC152_14410 [Arcobacter sp. 15-2]|uniref:hypothetical protein n=1 Tax=Arcobacter sp. 15-2 TaxID=3374109 RepID=UPI00399CE134